MSVPQDLEKLPPSRVVIREDSFAREALGRRLEDAIFINQTTSESERASVLDALEVNLVTVLDEREIVMPLEWDVVKFTMKDFDIQIKFDEEVLNSSGQK